MKDFLMTLRGYGRGLVGFPMLLALIAAPVQATLITFNYDIEFSGGTPPGGPAPWLTATFDDGGTPGSVTLTLSTAGLSGSEFIDGTATGTGGWYFNLNPAYNANNLTFTFVSGNNADGILTGTNAFQADGDGLYDVRFQWNPPPGSRLNAGQTVQYMITGIAALVAGDFNFLSAPAGGHGPFLSAAHVMGIGPYGNDSGWVAPGNGNGQVPIPSTLLLVGGGLLALAGWRRFRA